MSVSRHASVPRDTDTQAAFVGTLVDEWVRGGVSHAVVCPGSRSTPLALALDAHPGISVHIRLDERSAAFTALGIGLVSGHPAVLVTTSGTAAAELHAAVVEADLARVPMLACTADRPPELRDVGAPQTIDQHRLFGEAVRWFADPGVANDANRGSWRSLGARSLVETVDGPYGPGPVHLNLPFREPLLGDPTAGRVPPGRDGGHPWHQVCADPSSAPAQVVERIAAAARAGVRGLIVAGAGCGAPEAVLAASEALGWPVIADPRSGLRSWPGALVAAADGILRSESFAAEHQPGLVLRLGESWVSKVVSTYLRQLADGGTELLAIDPWWRWQDPDRSVNLAVRSDPTPLCWALADTVAGSAEGDPSWMAGWMAAELAAQSAIDRWLRASASWSEPKLARELLGALPPEAELMVSSSMPIRDVEAFGSPRVGFPRVLSNRGVNGIDGVVSTALGVAMGSARPVTALVGDLAFLHDISAFVRAPDRGHSVTVVVADNGGGGIFSFLPPAAGLDPGSFETLFGTPQDVDVARVAAGFDVSVTEIGEGDDMATLSDAVKRGALSAGLSVVRVRLPAREQNVELHGRINQAIVAAVDQQTGVVATES